MVKEPVPCLAALFDCARSLHASDFAGTVYAFGPLTKRSHESVLRLRNGRRDRPGHCQYLYLRARGRGIVLNEPSIVAFNNTNGQIEAVGTEAHEMLAGRPPTSRRCARCATGSSPTSKPPRRCSTHFVRKVHGKRPLVRPRLVIGVPPEITPVERRAVKDSGYRVKASEVHLVDEPMAAAIGSGLP